MVGRKSVLQTFILAGHDLVLFKLAGLLFLAGQLVPLGHRNVDGVIVVIAVDFSIRMVTLTTWHNIAIAAGAALVITALVARVSHIGCIAPTLTLVWLGTSFNVLRILGTLLPDVPGRRHSWRRVK